eukprot:1155180-Pelagomonas_calceolata.AAC.3
MTRWKGTGKVFMKAACVQFPGSTYQATPPLPGGKLGRKGGGGCLPDSSLGHVNAICNFGQKMWLPHQGRAINTLSRFWSIGTFACAET